MAANNNLETCTNFFRRRKKEFLLQLLWENVTKFRGKKSRPKRFNSSILTFCLDFESWTLIFFKVALCRIQTIGILLLGLALCRIQTIGRLLLGLPRQTYRSKLKRIILEICRITSRISEQIQEDYSPDFGQFNPYNPS